MVQEAAWQVWIVLLYIFLNRVAHLPRSLHQNACAHCLFPSPCSLHRILSELKFHSPGLTITRELCSDNGSFFWLCFVASGILSSPTRGLNSYLPAVKAPCPNHWTASELPDNGSLMRKQYSFKYPPLPVNITQKKKGKSRRFSSVASDSFRPHGPAYARLPVHLNANKTESLGQKQAQHICFKLAFWYITWQTEMSPSLEFLFWQNMYIEV